jgi:hypothetical protein
MDMLARLSRRQPWPRDSSAPQGGSSLVGCGPPAAGPARGKRCAAPRSEARAEGSKKARPGRAGVTLGSLNFRQNLNRRRGALRPDAPAERSPRRMVPASVLQDASTVLHTGKAIFIASVRPIGTECARCSAFVQPALPSTQLAGAKPALSAQLGPAALPTRPPLPARRRGETRRAPSGA